MAVTHVDAWYFLWDAQWVSLLDRQPADVCSYRAILRVQHTLVVIRVSSYLSYVIASIVLRQDNAGARKFYQWTRSIMVARGGSNRYRQTLSNRRDVGFACRRRQANFLISKFVSYMDIELQLLWNVQLELYLMHQCRAFYLILLRRVIIRKSDLKARVVWTLVPVANELAQLLLP